jgi:hypothetical protein
MGYIYVAETATTRLRAKTTGIAIFGIQGMATVYVYIAPIMLNSPALGMSNTGKLSPWDSLLNFILTPRVPSLLLGRNRYSHLHPCVVLGAGDQGTLIR